MPLKTAFKVFQSHLFRGLIKNDKI